MLTWFTRLEGDGLSGRCLSNFEQDLGQSDSEDGRGKKTKNITERKNLEGGNILAEKRKPNAWKLNFHFSGQLRRFSGLLMRIDFLPATE